MYTSVPDIPNTSDGQHTLLTVRSEKGICFTAFPIAHGGGVESGLLLSVYLGHAIVMVQNDPLSVETLLTVIRQTGCQHALLTPYTCAALVQSPNKSEIYEKMTIINFAGGK